MSLTQALSERLFFARKVQEVYARACVHAFVRGHLTKHC